MTAAVSSSLAQRSTGSDQLRSMRPYDGASYHGTPALKPAPWDWKVPLYIAIGGAAGGAQIISQVVT